MKRAWTILWAACAVAQVRLPPHETVTLANGLRVILAPNREVPLVTLRVLARGGAEMDPVERAGVSDVTAELLQRGAGGRSAQEFAAQLDALGAEWRAGATPQAIEIELEFLARDTAPALGLLGDALAKPTFAEAEVKKALAESIDAAKSVKDDAGEASRYYAKAMMFGASHPYGRLPDEVSLARITRDDIVRLHRQAFAARNLTVVAAGDFVPAAMRAEMERALGGLPAGEAHAWLPPRAAPNYDAPRLLLVDKPDATQTYFSIMMPGVERGHPDRAALWLVNTLFGERFTSMLNDELRVNSGLTYGASSRVEMNRLPGAITIYSYTKTESTVAAIDLALAVLRRLRDKGIDAAQLASAKAYIKGKYPTDALETSRQVAAVLGDLALFGLNRGEVDDLFSRLDAVTPAKATEVARRFFTDANLQFCLVGNAAAMREDVAKYAARRKEIAITSPGVAVPEF